MCCVILKYGLQISTSHHQMGICNMTTFVRLPKSKKSKRFIGQQLNDVVILQSETQTQHVMDFYNLGVTSCNHEIKPIRNQIQRRSHRVQVHSRLDVFTFAKHLPLNPDLSWPAVKWSVTCQQWLQCRCPCLCPAKRKEIKRADSSLFMVVISRYTGH